MKVLAVRGKNLASLHGSFEVDFRGPALGRAGLFSITGPTGAGKTTLLDAICLALFDKTPRFDGRGGVEIGGAGEDPALRIRTRDVRGILRRGAVRAEAEVDFLGADDREYRARWEVWRARERVDGKLQDQRMELTDLATMRRIGERKSDVLAEIEARLGLSFDQFRRSVLLAQGEFSAFLRADAAGRAELLERMTHTEIYRDLSRAAYEKARELRQTLALAVSQLDALGIAAPEQRAALEQGATATRERLKRCRSAAQAARAHYEHLESTGRLEREREAARQAEARAREQRDLAGPRRQHLAQVVAAHELAPWVERRDGERRLTQELDAQLEAARSEVLSCGATLEAANVRLGAAQRAYADAEAALERARPRLEQAREAQQGQVEASRVHDGAKVNHAGAKARLEEAQRARDEAVARRAGLQAVAQQAEGVLSRLGSIRSLAQSWDHLRDDLHELSELVGEQPDLARARELANRAQADAKQALAVATEQRDQARAASRRARSRLAAAEKARSALPPGEELRRRRLALDRALGELRILHDMATKAAALDDAMGADADRVETFTRAAAHASKKWDQARLEGARLDGQISGTRTAIRRLEATLDLLARRADLVDGEPCPLCGAQHHPSAHEAAPDRELGEARLELEALVGRRRDIVAAEGALAAESASSSARARECEDRIRQARLDRADLARQFGATVAGLGPTPVDETESTDRDQLNLLGLTTASDDLSVPPIELSEDLDRGAVATTWALVDACEQRRRSVLELEADVEQRTAQIRTWREALSEAERSEEAAREALSVARESTLHADHDVQEATKRIDAAARARARLIKRLTPAFSSWPEQASPVDLRHATRDELVALQARTDAWVEEIREAEASLAASAAERASLAERIVQLDATLGERTTQVDALAEALAKARQALDEAQRHSGTFFEGRSVAEVEGALGSALEGCGRERDAARKAQEDGAQARALAGQRLDSLVTQRAAAAKRLESVVAELDRARESRDLSPESLTELLGTPAVFVERERLALERLDAELAAATAVTTERTRRLEHHRKRRPEPPEGLDTSISDESERAAQWAAARDAELEQAQEEAAEAAALLRQDDHARIQREALAPRIELVRKHSERADRLSEVIGSASGTKFQAFAQSLTLEVLLGHANAHLRDLKPRYQLSRVPGQDLELQLVDRDLGHEVRSIHSLSGGESFLVSLALALGLSSLSAHNCRIDSLFIDEGFGTLDAHTLEVALDTLDSLQGEGRQIGIISHVPGMAERIGVEVRVEPQSAGRSRVRVVSHGLGA